MDNLYNSILENLDEGIYFVDTERRITFWNKAAEIITGYKSNEVLGSFCYDNILKHVDDFGNQLCLNGCPLEKTIGDRKKREVKVYLHHKEGYRVRVYVKTIPLIDKNDKVLGAIEIFSEQSELRKDFEMYKVQNLKKLAYRDQLTGLYNRTYLNEYINLKFREFKKFGREFSIMFLDVDHFKNINDSYGHDIGDKVLKLLAKTLRKSIRKSDLVIRWGGEEFIILSSDLDDRYLEELANTIRILVENTILEENGNNIKVTISIGATKIKSDDTPKAIIKRADDLMYKSKKNGRNQVTTG